MTENEKIELFDKWYGENYDEWAEGEEGIALREELEQAFKGGIAELEKENAELRAKESFVGAQNRKLCEQQQKIEVLEKENAELKSEKGCETCTKFDEVKLTKANELLKRCYDNYIYLQPLRNDIEQFLKDIEVE